MNLLKLQEVVKLIRDVSKVDCFIFRRDTLVNLDMALNPSLKEEPINYKLAENISPLSQKTG